MTIANHLSRLIGLRRHVAALSAITIAAWFALTPESNAQTYWRLSYTGTATHTNGSGQMVTEPMTDGTLIQRCAQAGGTDTNQLALALHINGTTVGDTIEVVNVNDPNLFRCEVFTLGFQESFTNSAGTLVKSFAYVYNNESAIFPDPSDHSRGGVVITKMIIANRNGATNVVITGKAQFWIGQWLDNAPATNAVVCAGTFTAKGPLNLP